MTEQMKKHVEAIIAAIKNIPFDDGDENTGNVCDIARAVVKAMEADVVVDTFMAACYDAMCESQALGTENVEDYSTFNKSNIQGWVSPTGQMYQDVNLDTNSEDYTGYPDWLEGELLAVVESLPEKLEDVYEVCNPGDSASEFILQMRRSKKAGVQEFLRGLMKQAKEIEAGELSILVD